MVRADTCTQSFLWVIIFISYHSILLFGHTGVVSGLSLHGAKSLGISSVNSDAIGHVDVLTLGQALVVETSRPEEFLWPWWLILRISCWWRIKHQISEYWEHLSPSRVFQRMQLHIHRVVHLPIYAAVWRLLLMVLIDDRGAAFVSVCCISYVSCICW